MAEFNSLPHFIDTLLAGTCEQHCWATWLLWRTEQERIPPSKQKYLSCRDKNNKVITSAKAARNVTAGVGLCDCWCVSRQNNWTSLDFYYIFRKLSSLQQQRRSSVLWVQVCNEPPPALNGSVIPSNIDRRPSRQIRVFCHRLCGMSHSSLSTDVMTFVIYVSGSESAIVQW